MTAVNAPRSEADKRAAAKRMVWALGLVALLIYIGFIVSGVFGIAGSGS